MNQIKIEEADCESKSTIYSLISFPRSGQHLSERLIEKICQYFSRDFKYCEFYTCCKTIPCKKNSIFLKNHDFGLDLTLPEDYKKIILYRESMIEQLESFFRAVEISKKQFFINRTRWIEDPNIVKTMSFDYKTDKNLYYRLLKFIKNKEQYYNEFINKWVTTPSHNTLVLAYSGIITDPYSYVDKIMSFMEIPHDEQDINNILNDFEKIEYKHSLEPTLYERIKNDLVNFKHYTPTQIIPSQSIDKITNSMVKKLPLQTMIFK